MPSHKSLVSFKSAGLPNLACRQLLAKTSDFEKVRRHFQAQLENRSKLWLHVIGDEEDGRSLVICCLKKWYSEINPAAIQFIELDASLKSSGIHLSSDLNSEKGATRVAVIHNFPGWNGKLPSGISRLLLKCDLVFSFGIEPSQACSFSGVYRSFRVAQISVPLIRNMRQGGFPALESAFRACGITGLSCEAKEFLTRNYGWPGNLRQWELFVRVFNAVKCNLPGLEESVEQIGALLELAESVSSGILVARSKSLKEIEELIDIFGVRFAEDGFSIWNLSRALAATPSLKCAAEKLKIPPTTLVHRRRPLEAARLSIPHGLF
jgi:hypothetical protein